MIAFAAATAADTAALVAAPTPEPSLAERFAGCVLSTFERNFYDDSDFCAVAYDRTRDCLVEFEYASTRYHSHSMELVPDATPEVIARAARLWQRTRWTALRAEAQAAAEAPAKGRRVRVVGGRKAKGVEGVVGWIAECAKFGRRGASARDTETRIGIDPVDAEGRALPRVFVAARQAVTCDPAAHHVGAEALRARVRRETADQRDAWAASCARTARRRAAYQQADTLAPAPALAGAA